VNSASGGWETWSWDESLFAGAAGYYEQGRLPYAPGLADAFTRSLALDGRGRLLDVGCGPGTVTLRLAPLFEAAVGLDPDPEMLARASSAAAGQGIGNVAWVRERAEALPAGLGSFLAVTFAQSFHWMDRPRVASAVATMLDAGGAAVQVDAPGYLTDEMAAEFRRGSLPFPPPPDGALDQLRRQYLGSDRRAGQGIRNTSPSGEDQVFRQAGFRRAEIVTVPDQRIFEQTADDIVARVFSSSSTAPHLFGDRQEDFETDMRQILAQASPPGRFSVRLPDNILRIWRLPALVACPAAVDWKHRAGEVGGLRVGEQQRGAGEFRWRGPPAHRDFGVEEARDVRVVIDPVIERRAERSGSQRVNGDPRSRDFDGEAAGELDDRALARGISGAARGAHQAEGAGEREDAAVSGCAHRADGGTAGEPGPHHVDLEAGAQVRDGQLVDGAEPARARASAMASPSPAEPPVTIDTCPRRDIGRMAAAVRLPGRPFRILGSGTGGAGRWPARRRKRRRGIPISGPHALPRRVRARGIVRPCSGLPWPWCSFL